MRDEGRLMPRMTLKFLTYTPEKMVEPLFDLRVVVGHGQNPNFGGKTCFLDMLSLRWLWAVQIEILWMDLWKSSEGETPSECRWYLNHGWGQGWAGRWYKEKREGSLRSSVEQRKRSLQGVKKQYPRDRWQPAVTSATIMPGKRGSLFSDRILDKWASLRGYDSLSTVQDTYTGKLSLNCR